MEYLRVAWRDIASATNERSSIAAVIPPRTVAPNTAHTVWGGLLDEDDTLKLAGLMCSFVFDYLVRSRGRTHLNYGLLDSIPAPRRADLQALVEPCRSVLEASTHLESLSPGVRVDDEITSQRLIDDDWQVGRARAVIDAAVTQAYGLTPHEYAAVLSTFPNLDTVQPMLPGEPKSFVTRDLALLTYLDLLGQERRDIVDLLDAAGVDLPSPHPDLRRLDVRVDRYRKLDAVPYRPTPRGGRPPTDPELIEAVQALLTDDAQTAADMAEALEEDEKAVKAVLEQLARDGEVYADGRGKRRRFYVVGDEE
jgi:hypothetical protein